MSTKVLNIVRGVGLAVSVLALSSLSAQAQTIYVGVAANFSVPLTTLAADFQTKNPGTTVSQVSKSTGVLKSEIIAGGATGPYDLFLAADQAAPADLVANHASLVVAYPSGNYPFHYTTGEIALWSSNANPVNISAGLPNPLTANFVIADPATAPYGYAAMQEVNNILSAGLTPSSSYPVTIGSYAVNIAANIDATYNAVAAGTYKYGFVAKSKICTRPMASCICATRSGTKPPAYTSRDHRWLSASTTRAARNRSMHWQVPRCSGTSPPGSQRTARKPFR